MVHTHVARSAWVERFLRERAARSASGHRVRHRHTCQRSAVGVEREGGLCALCPRRRGLCKPAYACRALSVAVSAPGDTALLGGRGCGCCEDRSCVRRSRSRSQFPPRRSHRGPAWGGWNWEEHIRGRVRGSLPLVDAVPGRRVLAVWEQRSGAGSQHAAGSGQAARWHGSGVSRRGGSVCVLCAMAGVSASALVGGGRRCQRPNGPVPVPRPPVLTVWWRCAGHNHRQQGNCPHPHRWSGAGCGATIGNVCSWGHDVAPGEPTQCRAWHILWSARTGAEGCYSGGGSCLILSIWRRWWSR